MRLSRRVVLGVAAFGLVGGSTAFAVGPAEAATTPHAADGCVFESGVTGSQGTNTHGLPSFGGGTDFTKPSAGDTTCHDFNLWSGTIGATYEGWLLYSNGNWGACTAGYVEYTGGSIVLCSDVEAGTTEGVTSSVGGGSSIEIED